MEVFPARSIFAMGNRSTQNLAMAVFMDAGGDQQRHVLRICHLS
jgi:hypothetical protein